MNFTFVHQSVSWLIEVFVNLFLCLLALANCQTEAKPKLIWAEVTLKTETQH